MKRLYLRLPYRRALTLLLLAVLVGVWVWNPDAPEHRVHGAGPPPFGAADGHAGHLASVLGQGGTQSQTFVETFTGTPAAPVGYIPPGWDVQIHHRDWQIWETIGDVFDASHGTACEPPEAVHTLTAGLPHSVEVFQCLGHLMTSIYDGDYGVIYLQPPAMADWSGGETVINWDVSTRKSSNRDWIDLWVTPFADSMVLPLDVPWPDLTGPPENAVHFYLDPEGRMLAHIIRNGVDEPQPLSNEASYNTVLTQSPSVRTKFEAHISRTHIKIGLPTLNLWWIDFDVADLGFTNGIVQFGHHSYNPAKDCSGGVVDSNDRYVLGDYATCYPGTWHWDNVTISPYLPLGITELYPRVVDYLHPGGWDFPNGAAPAGLTLQLAASNAPGFDGDFNHGAGTPSIDLSWDGGSSWTTYSPQPSLASYKDPLAARSYHIDVPPGATRVDARGTGGYWGGQWMAMDASLVTTNPDSLPATATPLPATATPNPSLSPTVTRTPTATQGIQTPTPQATATTLPTVTPGATWTPVATATPLVIPTVTGTHQCTVLGQQDGIPFRLPYPFC